MAAGQINLFLANLDNLSMADLVGATLKLSLHTSTYVPNIGTAGNSLYSAATNEIAAGNGYTAGGATLTNVAVTAVAGGWKISSDNVVWNAAGGNIPAWRHGVLYVAGSLWGMASPLLTTFLGDDTPADVPATTDGNPLTISCPAAGWFDKAQV